MINSNNTLFKCFQQQCLFLCNALCIYVNELTNTNPFTTNFYQSLFRIQYLFTCFISLLFDKIRCVKIMVYLNQFCCYWSSRRGSVIIGWFNIIFSAAGLLAVVIALMEKQFIQILITELINDVEHRYINGIITKDAYEKELFFYENISRLIPYLLAIGGFLCILCIIANASLLIGVTRKRTSLLSPWLIYTILQVGIQFGYTLGFSIFCISSGDTEFGIVNIIISLLTLCIGLYMWIIVYSVRKDIFRMQRPFVCE